jgi:hypothetical protein
MNWGLINVTRFWARVLTAGAFHLALLYSVKRCLSMIWFLCRRRGRRSCCLLRTRNARADDKSKVTKRSPPPIRVRLQSGESKALSRAYLGAPRFCVVPVNHSFSISLWSARRRPETRRQKKGRGPCSEGAGPRVGAAEKWQGRKQFGARGASSWCGGGQAWGGSFRLYKSVGC